MKMQLTTLKSKIIFHHLINPLLLLIVLSSDNFYQIISPINCDYRLNESLFASQHYNRILKYAKCQLPYARVVNIQNELHPSAIKKYIPHCTILHYCGPHSGCCRLENEECVPKVIEDVKLYFWTIELTPRGHKKGIEVITMKNHTECMCAPISSIHKKYHRNISTLRLNPISTSTTTTMEPRMDSTILPSKLIKTNNLTDGNLT